MVGFKKSGPDANMTQQASHDGLLPFKVIVLEQAALEGRQGEGFTVHGRYAFPCGVCFPIRFRGHQLFQAILSLIEINQGIVTGKQIGRASCRERVCLYV